MLILLIFRIFTKIVGNCGGICNHIRRRITHFSQMFPVLQYFYSQRRLHIHHAHTCSTYLLLWDNQFKLSSHLQWISIRRWQCESTPPNTATNAYFHLILLRFLIHTSQVFVPLVAVWRVCVCAKKFSHFLTLSTRQLDLNYDVIIKIILLFI